MANLPACRSKEVAPFTHSGVDMFGPFTVKQRSTVMQSQEGRALHIEVNCLLETDSFILALQRLVA